MVAKETDKRRQLLSIVCTIFYLTAFFYPGPRSFYWKFSPREREGERRLGGSGLDLQFQFREDDSCQTRQSEQWQLLTRAYQSLLSFSGGRPQRHKPCSLRKRLSVCCSVRLSTSEKLPSNTEVKMSSNNIHVNLIFTLFTCILHVLRMQYFKNNFPQTIFTSRIVVRYNRTSPSVVPI